jgi:hypothetical protein
MRRFGEKGLSLSIICLFIGGAGFSTIDGFHVQTMRNDNLFSSSFLDNNTFDDYTDDVFLFMFKAIQSRMYRTDEKPNINIVSGSYSLQGGNATLTMEVKGVIENRGNLTDPNSVLYFFILNTSENFYDIVYCNRSCSDRYGNVINVEVNGSTLSVTFGLNTTSETMNSLVIDAFDIHIDNDTFQGALYYDSATNVEYSMDMKITKPGNYLYLCNRQIVPLFSPVVFGKITVEFEDLLNDPSTGIFSELYIDGELTATPDSKFQLVWKTLSFGKHTLKVIAFDVFGNRDSDEIEVWKFF